MNPSYDLRFALRQLRRSPGFAFTAVLTLALGIGANTAIFSLLDQALLRSLPVHAPQELVILEATGTMWDGGTHNHGGTLEAYFSYPMYKDLRDQDKAFDGLLATLPADVGIVRNHSSENGRAELVSGNYFSVLGVHPALGRLLTQNDDLQKGGSPVVVLSFDYWKNHLGASPSVVGTTLAINSHPYQIVGVAAPGFRSAVWGETPNLFVPITMMDDVIPGTGARLDKHTERELNIIGRLKPGESIAQAQAASAPLWHALRAEESKALGEHSKRFTDDFLVNSRLNLVPGGRGFSYQRDDFQKPLLAVMGMALLVLLIACVNVASLLLVRSAGRAREFSLRYALGAGASRIAQQVLLEGLLIGLGGGVAGMLLAPMATRALVRQLAGDSPYVAFTSSIDTRVLLFNFAIALVASILFSLAPLVQLRRPNLSAAMGQKSATSPGGMVSFRRAVVCLQIGLSILLIVGAGLFVRTMQNLRHVNVGFTTAHLVTFGINPKLAGYAPDAVPALHQRALDALTAIPGVEAVAATDDPELAGDSHGGNVLVAGFNPPPDTDYDVEEPYTNPGYFAGMQIPLLAGHLFTETDTLDHPKVAIVNEAFAKLFCGSVPACVGRRMRSGGGTDLDTEIVGVVRDNKHSGIRDAAVPTLFRPIKQNPSPARLYFYLRTYADPAEMLTTVRRTMQQVDPSLTLSALRTMDAQIDEDLSNERMVSLLAVSFGILATFLAGIGLYGVLAYSTAQRTREIGIRIALGSSRLGVSRIVVADVLKLAAMGILISLPVAFGLSRLLQSQLFGVSPTDPLTLGGAILLIVLVAFVAAFLPARRAAMVDPMAALGSE